MARPLSAKGLLLREKERQFRESLERKDWNTVYFLIDDCCNNIALSFIGKYGLYGIRAENVLERKTDAVIKVFEKLKIENKEIRTTLATYCFQWVRYYLQFNKTAQQQDKEEQLSVLDDYDDDEDHYCPYTESFEDNLIERLTREGY